MHNIDIESLEGRTFILGREGHIYIDSSTASKHHAEIRIFNGRIHLRDLDSTNGTYLIRNNKLVFFEKGYVNPLQPVVIGDQKYVIWDLLSIANDFVALDDAPTEIELGSTIQTVQGSG